MRCRRGNWDCCRIRDVLNKQNQIKHRQLYLNYICSCTGRVLKIYIITVSRRSIFKTNKDELLNNNVTFCDCYFITTSLYQYFDYENKDYFQIVNVPIKQVRNANLKQDFLFSKIFLPNEITGVTVLTVVRVYHKIVLSKIILRGWC